jgi:hypothetical protein
MRPLNFRLSLVIFVLLLSQVSLAKESLFTKSNSKQGNVLKSRAAGCSPATARTTMNLNNVRALIETGGSLWQDRSTGTAAYEVPAGSGKTALFAGSLWLGGVDANNQLRLAAVRFRQIGNDYWPGPLTETSAVIDAATCEEYDRFWRVSKQEVEEFRAYQRCLVDPTCNVNELFPGYEIPQAILNWPAHGDISKGQSYHLAPFYDRNGDDFYEPMDGDYPWYDLDKEIDCQTRDRNDPVQLYGDETIWWVFNDRGNIHSESGGEPIGMEIRAQAFSFATNDEVNNMTFYNYEMINQGTQTLYQTYFGQWVDADLGFAGDDYVGCDVSRGLGYCYNGDGDDEGPYGYGANPPAIGVDFFEGPYQDADNKDNPLTTDINVAQAELGIPYEGLGVGYGDEIIDNERFGMRKFLYHNNDATNTGDPETDIEYYNFMNGKWKLGDVMTYGGNGNDPSNTIQADYMFPGDTDPHNWGTHGVDPGQNWDEQSAGNLPEDRRFLQAAGPFTLEPGARNNITVGVVYARAYDGNPFSSVEALRLADDKAQALFDNCFKILDGPQAPDLSIQELDRELIITISNSPNSNNGNETYAEFDPFIPEELFDGTLIPEADRYYRFQGYQVFQIKDETVSVSDLGNIDLARLAFQCDINDGVSQLINFNFDEQLSASVPVEMVDGNDDGITHSFRVTDDLFAQGDRRLINHLNYHYIAIAYAHNNYKTYNPNDGATLDGQKYPYKASRRSASGAIRSYSGIPHIPAPEAGGTHFLSEYGDGPEITRIEGQGNGGLVLDITPTSEATLFSAADHKIEHPVYQKGKGPITVKVIDPLNVPNHDFRLVFLPDSSGPDVLDSAYWVLENLTTGVTINSDRTIEVGNEQLLPEWGISITIEQQQYVEENLTYTSAEFLEGTMQFADSSQMWLTGVPDAEGFTAQNWIRSGNVKIDQDEDPIGAVFNDHYKSLSSVDHFKDAEEKFESILGGTWAPYTLTSWNNFGPAASQFNTQLNYSTDILQSVDVVITSDTSKWTRCPVIEMAEDNNLSEGQVDRLDLRAGLSVDKNGHPDGSGTRGMGWFPGYAINLETGERLNMAFGENSWLAGENGRDMKWNPTTRISTSLGTPLFGGMHYVYVFNNDRGESGNTSLMPHYDEGAYMHNTLENGSLGFIYKVWRSAMWVGLPLLEEEQQFLSNDVRVRLRVSKPYENYLTTGENNALPMYEFTLDGMSTSVEDHPTASDALDLINVVPNPYYAYSMYETNKIDNRIKITNLPERCNITIYTVSGTMVKQFTKDAPITSLDWNLKNGSGIPVASGVYIIHIDVPGVGERILKWFGVMREVDLEKF